MALRVSDDEDDSKSSDAMIAVGIPKSGNEKQNSEGSFLQIVHKSDNKVTIRILGGPYYDAEQFINETGTMEYFQDYMGVG